MHILQPAAAVALGLGGEVKSVLLQTCVRATRRPFHSGLAMADLERPRPGRPSDNKPFYRKYITVVDVNTAYCRICDDFKKRAENATQKHIRQAHADKLAMWIETGEIEADGDDQCCLEGVDGQDLEHGKLQSYTPLACSLP